MTGSTWAEMFRAVGLQRKAAAAVGISGDVSDKDEAGLQAAGLTGDTGR